jgi:hypothetical protein
LAPTFFLIEYIFSLVVYTPIEAARIIMILLVKDFFFYTACFNISFTRRFEPWSGQTKDYEIAICCFSTKHAALRRKNKDWLAQNQDNVSEWGDMSIRRLAINEFGIKYWTSNPVWVKFQEHGRSFYVNIEEKVWLLVKKIRTWKDWQGDIFQAWSNFISTRFFGGRFSLWTVMPPVTESYAQL